MRKHSSGARILSAILGREVHSDDVGAIISEGGPAQPSFADRCRSVVLDHTQRATAPTAREDAVDNDEEVR